MNLGETRVDVVVDFSKADAQAKAFMSQLSGKPVEVPVTISDKARGDAKRIMSELRAEASKKIEIPLSVKDQTAAALASINAKLAGFSKQDRTAVLKISAGQAEAELKRINGLIAKADDTEVDILVVARDKATAQLNAVNQALGNTEKKAVSAGAALRNTFGRVFAGAAFVQGIRTAIDAASDLEQSIGGVETVFGEASAPIIAFGKNAAEAVGLANDQFLSFATNIGGALKRAGLPMDEVASKTTQLITLAADLAATYGGTTAEAVTALTAAFRGEFDSLERFNTGLTQTAVNARAVDLGLSEGTGTITQYARTMATLSLVMEQTTDAQGQFARESDTAAHQQQVALAKLRDAAASLGAALLPVFTKIADVVGKVAGVFGSLPGPVQSVVVALAGLALIANPVEKAVSAVTKLGGAIQKLGGGKGLGNLALGGLKVGGLVTAVVAAGSAFQSFRAHEEAVAAQSKELFDIIAQGGDVFSTLAAQLQAIPNDNPIGDALTTVSLGLVEFSSTQTRFDAALKKSGVTAKDVANALNGDVSPALQRLIDVSGEFQDAKGGGFFSFDRADINALAEITDQTGLSADELTAFQETYERIAETVSAARLAKGLDQAKGAFEDFWTGAAPPPTLEEQLAQVQAAFKASVDIGDVIRGAVPDWTHVQTGMADLRRELGLVGEEFDKAAENSTAFAQTLRSEDWKSASFDSALSSIQKYQQETLGLIDLVQDRKSAITDFKDAVEGLNFDDIAASTPEAIKGLEGIANVLSVDLANAWTASEGNADAFVLRSVAATDTLIASLGLSADEADKLKVALRATEGDFRAQVDVIINNEAILKLQLLSDTLDQLPPDVQTQVKLQIANGDFAGALKTQLDALTEQQHDVNLRVTMDTLQAEGQLDGLTTPVRTATVEAVASIAEATGDFDSLSDEDRQARITAVAELVEAQGGLDGLTEEERQAIIDTIAHTTKASDSIEDVETAKYEAGVTLDAVLEQYNTDVAAATRAREVAANLVSDGTVHNAPKTINVTAVISAPRLGAGRVLGGQQAQGSFNPNASSPLQAFAAGGMSWDDSQANKWGAGRSMFQIREPETGGESFIPHARSKWARSRRIWWETGKALGMIAMADGGVTSMAQQVIGPYVPPTWMVDLLRRSGSSVKDFEDSLKDGPEAIDALLSKLKKQGLAADDIVKIDKELIKALNILRLQALQAAAAQQQVAQTGGGGGSDGTAADTAEADAAAELNDQLVGQAEAFETATNANFQYQIALGSADWGRSAIESAEKAFGEFTDGLFAGVDATLDRQDAMKGFFDVIASSITLAEGEEDPMGMVRIGRALQQINQSGGFSSLAGQARELNSAFKAVAETVDEQLSQAFQDANGDSAAFLTAATAIGDKVIADMQLTGEAAEAVRAQLGLTAGDYEARFKLAGADEAFKRLSLLKTSLDALNNDELSAQIDVLIAQGDFTGALKLAQDALDKNALEVKTKANTTDTEKALKALADETRVAIIEVRLDASGIPADYASIIQAIRTGNLPIGLTTHARGGTAGPWGGIAGEMWMPEIVNGHVVSSPTYVSPGTQVTGVAATQARLRPQGAQGTTGASQATVDYDKLARMLAEPMTRALTSAVRQMVRGA